MHPLLARISGRSAIANWRNHVADAEKAATRYTVFSQQCQTASDAIQTARLAFAKHPTPVTFEKWLTAESRQAALGKLHGDISQLAGAAREEALASGGAEILRAAVDEALNELAGRAALVKADDAARSAEAGVVIESTAMLAAIQRIDERLREARSWRGANLANAAGALGSVIGAE